MSGTAANRAVPDLGHGGKNMSVYKELRQMGYEFDHEYGDSEERMEVWVNRETGMGIMLQWFRLAEVEA